MNGTEAAKIRKDWAGSRSKDKPRGEEDRSKKEEKGEKGRREKIIYKKKSNINNQEVKSDEHQSTMSIDPIRARPQQPTGNSNSSSSDSSSSRAVPMVSDTDGQSQPVD